MVIPVGLYVHSFPTSRRRKPNKIRHLRDSIGCVSWWPSLCGGLLSEVTVRRRQFGRLCRGGVGALARLGIVEPGDHTARTGGTSRVFHPLRRGASERSAKGRSATRSDSQRLHGRTRWDGHPAWESMLGPCIALPTANQPTVAAQEKNGGASHDFSRSVCGTAVTAKAVRPFLFWSPRVVLW